MKNIKRLTLTIVGVGFGMLVSSVAVAVPKISDARVDAQIKSINTRNLPISKEIRQKVMLHMQQTEALKNEALAQGINKTPDYLVNLENMKSTLLARELIFDFNKKHPVTPAELTEAYKKLLAENANKKSYLVQHILRKTEAEAAQVIVKLRKGKSFASLAKTSIDAGSSQKAGSLGWVSADELDPKFAEAMVKLNKGQLTQKPVHSSYGWHVIKVDDVRQNKQPTFAEAKNLLNRQIMQEKIHKYVSSLLIKAGLPAK